MAKSNPAGQIPKGKSSTPASSTSGVGDGATARANKKGPSVPRTPVKAGNLSNGNAPGKGSISHGGSLKNTSTQNGY